MTANELADAVEGAGDNSFNVQASRMLRKQAKEIEALKLRELSDEEILLLTNDSNIFKYREFNDDMVRFARAILKKVRER